MFLFSEFAEKIPLEAILVAVFLVGLMIYLQVVFAEGIWVGIGRFFQSTDPSQTAFLFTALSLFLLIRGRKIANRSYPFVSMVLLAAFLVGSMTAFAVWSRSYGFFS